MTLITRIHFREVIIFFADLLVSSASSDQRVQIDLPAAPDANSTLPHDSPYQILGLRQKLNIIGFNSIVGFAGSMLQARALAKRLTEMSDSKQLTPQAFEAMFGSMPDNEKSDLSIVSATTVPRARGADIHTLDYDVRKGSVRGGSFVAAGSGERLFRKFLPNLLRISPVPFSDDRLYDWGDLFALNLAANCVGREMFTQQNLFEMWGGGFEIATFQSSGRFEKLDDILFLFFIVSTSPVGDECAIQFIPHLIKHNYYDQDLHVRVLDCIALPNEKYEVREDRTQIVLPLVRPASKPISRATPPLTSRYLCCFLISPDKQETSVSVYHDALDERPFQVAVVGDSAEFSFNEGLYGDIRERVSAWIGMPAKFYPPC